jgi:hypothetical protein
LVHFYSYLTWKKFGEAEEAREAGEAEGAGERVLEQIAHQCSYSAQSLEV